MAYTKQTWATGDTITAEKLNHMEDGIAGGTLVIGGFSYDANFNIVGTSDKTWQEIHDAMLSKICVAVIVSGNKIDQQLVASADVVQGAPGGDYSIFIGEGQFTTSTANGYPTVPGG